MKNKIINYLTLQFAHDEKLQLPVGRTIREAYILAQKKYKEMSLAEKKDLLNKINSR
tara:strand:- start:133 stop:303 length:171 start_codon:yes stop_codon:yes gene_type:complete